jgi:hypothetical protein
MNLTTLAGPTVVEPGPSPLDGIKSMIEKELEERVKLQNNEFSELRNNCCSDKKVCISFVIAGLFKIGIFILALFFILQPFHIKQHLIPTGYTYYNGVFEQNCNNNNNVLCEPYNDGCMCTLTNIGLTREERIRNVILDIITYLIPVILSGIITYIEWILFVRLRLEPRRTSWESITDGTDILYNTLDLFAPELNGVTATIGLVYKSRIDKLIYGTDLSQGCKDALYLYFANKVYDEYDEDEIEVHITKCDSKRDPLMISIYEIPRNKLFRYQYFVALSKEMNLSQYIPTLGPGIKGSGTNTRTISREDTSHICISVLDDYSIEDYKALLDFVNDVYPPESTDYNSLYRIAEAYGMTDCMGYCYLLYPELFTVIRPTAQLVTNASADRRS